MSFVGQSRKLIGSAFRITSGSLVAILSSDAVDPSWHILLRVMG